MAGGGGPTGLDYRRGGRKASHEAHLNFFGRRLVKTGTIIGKGNSFGHPGFRSPKSPASAALAFKATKLRLDLAGTWRPIRDMAPRLSNTVCEPVDEHHPGHWLQKVPLKPIRWSARPLKERFTSNCGCNLIGHLVL